MTDMRNQELFQMRKAFGVFFIAAWFPMLIVTLMATPSGSAEVSPPTSGPVKVHVTIFIIDTDEINSANQTFDANVYIQNR